MIKTFKGGLLLAATVGVFSLSACTTETVIYNKKANDHSEDTMEVGVCNATSAYDRGYQDGTESNPMSTKFLLNCNSFIQEKLQSSYKQGYSDGNQKKPLKKLKY